jgi:hypothetical protein
LSKEVVDRPVEQRVGESASVIANFSEQLGGGRVGQSGNVLMMA